MKNLVVALTVVFCTLLGGYGLTQLHSVAYAQGQQAAIDAGQPVVHLDAGQPTLPESAQLHDATVDPVDFLGDLKSAKKKGWFALVLVAAYGLLVAIGKLDKKVPWLGFLNKGKTAMAIAGGVVVVGAAMDMLFNGGTLVNVGVAAMTAFVGLLMPKPADSK